MPPSSTAGRPAPCPGPGVDPKVPRTWALPPAERTALEVLASHARGALDDGAEREVGLADLAAALGWAPGEARGVLVSLGRWYVRWEGVDRGGREVWGTAAVLPSVEFEGDPAVCRYALAPAVGSFLCGPVPPALSFSVSRSDV